MEVGGSYGSVLHAVARGVCSGVWREEGAVGQHVESVALSELGGSCSGLHPMVSSGVDGVLHMARRVWREQRDVGSVKETASDAKKL